MKTLRVLIPDAWPDRPEAHWAVVDEAGRIDSEGHSEPRHWPQTERTEIILSGSQVSWHTVRMPRASLREQTKSLGFAVEEHLLREPDSQHSTPTLQGEESWSVLIVARERLRRLCAQFQTLRRPLDAAYAALATLPWEAGYWTLATDGEALLVRHAEHAGFCDDISPNEQAPWVLSETLEQARAAGTLPQALRVLAAQRARTDWSSLLSVPVEAAGEWQWHQIGSATNLLHGEFAARHRTDAWLKHLKPAAIVVLCVFMADLLLGGLEVSLRRHELSTIKADMTRLLKSQLPGTAVLDPALQMRRELNNQRVAHGQYSDDAPWVLLAQLSSALGAEATNAISALRFENGTLNVVFAPTSLDLAGLQQRLAAQGIRAIRREGDGMQLSLTRNPT